MNSNLTEGFESKKVPKRPFGHFGTSCFFASFLEAHVLRVYY